MLFGKALQDVAIGGEVRGIGDDCAAPRPRGDGSAAELVEVHRCRVAYEGLPCGSAQRHLPEEVAYSLR